MTKRRGIANVLRLKRKQKKEEPTYTQRKEGNMIDVRDWQKILPPDVWESIWRRAQQLKDRGFFDMYAYILTECEAYAKLYGLQAPEPDLSEPKPKEPAISIKDAAMLLQGKDPSLS
jgi:hypothetical protein